MKHFFLYLLAALLLAAGPARAMNPLGAVVVPSGTTTTFTGAPNKGSGAVTTYNNNYYQRIDIQSGGIGVFNDGENVDVLIVRTGGTLRFGLNGEVSKAISNSTVTNTITLEPGAIVQLANPNGLPFASGSYAGNNPGNPNGGSTSFYTTPFTVTGLEGADYRFIGTAAQTTAAPAPAARGGYNVPLPSGIALPGTVAKLSFQNNGGSASTVTITNNTSVTQELHFTFGRVIVASGVTLSTVSNASSTTILDYNSQNGGGSVEGPGTFAVQRYLDGSLNGGTGYRHLSAPLTGQTVASFANGSYTPTVNPAYNSAPGSVPAASFPTVFSYDETRVGGSIGTVGFNQGWLSPTNLGDALVMGRGYTVNLPPTTATGATLTYTGTPSAAGAQFSSLGHTTANGGFHLLGNPFGAPINWDLQTSAGNFYYGGLATALYVFKSSGQYAGSYTTYVPGAPGNTGTNVVPMGQAFFVYNPTVGTQGRITFSPSYTITSYSAAVAGTPVQRTTAETRPYLALTLQDAAATHAHSTLVYFDGAATPGFDPAHDALYLPGAGQPVSVTTETAGQEYATNALPTLGTADVTVPLRLAATTAGAYQLRVTALENLPAGTSAYLLDATAGTRQALTTTSTVAVTLAAGTAVAGRYSLLFSRTNAPLATAPAALAALVSLYPNPATGTATLRLPAALRAGQPVAVQVLDALGRVVATATQPATADELSLALDQLAPGLYTVRAQAAGGTVSRRLTVQ